MHVHYIVTFNRKITLYKHLCFRSNPLYVYNVRMLLSFVFIEYNMFKLNEFVACWRNIYQNLRYTYDIFFIQN